MLINEALFCHWSGHITWSRQFFADISPWEHFNPMSWVVIRKQRPKIHRFKSCFQQSEALLEQFRRSTVEWFSTLGPLWHPQKWAIISKNWTMYRKNSLLESQEGANSTTGIAWCLFNERGSNSSSSTGKTSNDLDSGRSICSSCRSICLNKLKTKFKGKC